MASFKKDLKIELVNMKELNEINVRVKKGLFTLVSPNWEISQDLVEAVLAELTNNIGGTYFIEDYFPNRAVILYKANSTD
jgi:hypothetical protein